MEDIKESKKVLTDYMLELNADIQRAEDWANTGADEEMYFALKTVLDRLEQLEKENIEKLKAIEELGRDFEIIQHEHDRLDKRNNELILENKEYKEYIKRLDELNSKDFIFKHELENYIPKSVIREKIEELERDEEKIRVKKKGAHDSDRSKARMQAYLTKTIEIKNRLKELLGEEKWQN